MPGARLALALERISPGDWLVFERFAAEFLAPEYPSLRTTAAMQGDGGRDGQIYLIEEEPNAFVQYSVTADWNKKIRGTISTLKKNDHAVRILIYATNQVIGPAADQLIIEMRQKQRVSVDIRDHSWFTERELTYPQREIASEDLAKQFVDPLLAERGVKSYAAQVLSESDARVALLHLSLEDQDSASGKGLTKRCIESLTLSALHDINTECRITEEEVLSRVKKLLPSGHDQQVGQWVSSAVARLTRRGGPVKKDSRDQRLSMSFDEQQSLQIKVAQFALDEEKMKDELLAAIKISAPDKFDGGDAPRVLADDLKFGLETVLLRRGEDFARAVATGEFSQLDTRDILSVINATGRSSGSGLSDEEVSFAVLEVLHRPSPELRQHLRRLADAYTMYSFLRQTPDVQKAILQIFRGGEVWLDTSVILPLFAETLIDDPAKKEYTGIYQAMIDAGIKLFVTDGVLEELERHLNLALTFARTDINAWRSQVPFIYSAYALSGRARRDFAGWIEVFRGSHRPVDDVLEYLGEEHTIRRRNLKQYSDEADIALRSAIQEQWYKAHERRRVAESELDPATAQRLIEHDVENCVGVIELRKENPHSAVGHTKWFLTLDRTALGLTKALREEFGDNAPDSPALSPDFMAQYLRLAPVRSAVERERWINLPLLTDFSRYEYMPKELIEAADQMRRDEHSKDERIIRRRVRDRIDKMKLAAGPIALAGVRGSQERISGLLKSQIDPHLHAGN